MQMVLKQESGCGVSMMSVLGLSACTVRELERVHQWVSYRDDVFLYDHLVGILTTWLRPVSKPKLNCGLPALTKSGKQSKEHRP